MGDTSNNTTGAKTGSQSSVEDVPQTSSSAVAALFGHDMRSAVSEILGGLNLLEQSTLDDEAKQHLDRVTLAAQHLFKLLEAVQNPGADAVSQGVFALSHMVDRLRTRWGPDRLDSGASVRFVEDVAASAQLRHGRLELERVLGNLLENAAKYAPDGEIIVTLTQTGARGLDISVRDHGPGFSDAALKMLFTYGGRPDDESEPGTGLGLFITADLMRRLGGEIDARNLDDGAEVVINLPDIVLTQADLEARANPPVAAPASTVGPMPEAVQVLAGMSVLLAEDNATNQIVARQMMEALGADVILAADGLEALERFEETPFDLAVLDIEMPRKSGLEVMRAIRGREDARANTPLIALTAYVMREHRERIAAVGADGIIAKPLISVEALGQEFATLLAAIPDRAPAEGSDEPLVDLQTFTALRGTIGEEAFADLLLKLVEDLTGVRSKLNVATNAGDVAQARSGSHVLISLAGAIGARPLQDAAQALNSAAHAGQETEIKDHAKTCARLLEQVLAFLKKSIVAA